MVREFFEPKKIEFDGSALSSRNGTSFFENAQKVLEINRIVKVATSRRFNYILDGKPTSAMEMTLNLPSFPKDITLPRVYAISTPHSLAMLAGRWKVDSGGISFIPSRFDTGVPAQIDIAALTGELIQLPEMASLLSDPNLAEMMYITDLIRDPAIDMQQALWSRTGITVSRTQLDIHHMKDFNPDNPFGRYPSDHNNLKLEGINLNKCEILVLCDPFASGMQIVKALEVHVKKMTELNGKDEICLKRLLVFAPLSTLEGTAIIAYAAAKYGIELTVYTSASLLHARPPEMYWCPPFKDAPHLVIEPDWLKLIEHTEGEHAYGLDLWCNWAGKRLSPAQALKDSESMELVPIWGLTNIALLNRAQGVTPEVVRQMGLDPKLLVTTATILEAKFYGKENELANFVQSG